MSGARWVIQEENNCLVFRDTASPGRDFRIAFVPGTFKDFGRANFAAENKTLLQLTKWAIREENGVLVIRDIYSRPGDFRYAFFPASFQNFGEGGTVLYKDSAVLCSGDRWTICVEGGILVFRDRLSPGDNRFAFWPGQCTNP